MITFITQRLLQAMVVMIVISLICFFLLEHLTPALALTQSDNTIPHDYWQFLLHIFRGDFGTSYYYQTPVLSVIASKLPATLELITGAILLTIMTALPLGILAALFAHNPWSRLITGISVLGISTPIFLIATASIYLFAVELNWLPAFGRGETVHLWGTWETGYLTKDGLQHLLLPCASLAFVMLPLYVRLIRAELLEVLASDHVRYAQARGINPLRILINHGLRNILLPIITLGGMQLGTLIAYTVITEIVFQWHGLGFLFMEAVQRADTPLIIAYLMIVGGMFVIINTVIDMLYGVFNPRIRVVGE